MIKCIIVFFEALELMEIAFVLRKLDIFVHSHDAIFYL